MNAFALDMERTWHRVEQNGLNWANTGCGQREIRVQFFKYSPDGKWPSVDDFPQPAISCPKCQAAGSVR